ncbi:MAG: alpha-glucoside transport system substrate-binding protein [Ilumatobacteraceae bacterium]|jgi:alpha-glucoside transport system substrate-binding protein
MKKSRGAFSALCLAGVLVVAACGSDAKTPAATSPGGTTAPGATTGATTAPGGTTGGSAASGLLNGAIKCDKQYAGKEVHIFSPVRDSETDKAATRLRDAYAPLEQCTGVKVVYDGTDQFETEVKVRVDGGNPPDVIDFPQPGGFLDLIKKSQLFPFPDSLGAAVTADNVAGWPELATVNGKVYGVPARANVKSLVWYSPKMFADKGYKIPTTLEEVTTLSDQIVKDGGIPWCVGIESGVATGWPVTDWFEDFMMRINGPDVYDQWVQHKIPFNDPKVKAVADAVGAIIHNPAYIGGDNAVKAEATTKFQEGGFPILQGQCYMHKQASFYSTLWPKGTKVGADGDINSFYFPSKAGDPKYMLGGGDLIGAGTNKPETFDVLAYTNSGDYQAAIVKAGDTSLSTRKDFDTANFTDPVTKAFADLLKGSDVFRFDGADMMPAAIGSGAFWKEATAWIAGGDTTQQMLDNIEAAWKALPAG